MFEYDFQKEIIERLTRIETKQDNICLEVNKLDNRISVVEKTLNQHDNIIKIISKGTNWWFNIIGSGVGVLIGAILVSMLKSSCN